MRSNQKLCAICKKLRLMRKFRLLSTGYRHSYCLDCEKAYQTKRNRRRASLKKLERLTALRWEMAQKKTS